MMRVSPPPPCSRPSKLPSATRQRTGSLLLVLAGAVGLAAELALTEHWHDRWQYIPFALCLLISTASVVCLVRPGSAATRMARVVAVLTVIGACVGVGQHLWANATFTAEIRPSYTLSQLIIPAFTGASPALAPGALGLFGAWLWLIAPCPSER